ncbi:MAG: hypothetical protein ACW96U_00680 [Candidatus Heimdallarchaeaceae archaeon]|jgi:hypothetical protein
MKREDYIREITRLVNKCCEQEPIKSVIQMDDRSKEKMNDFFKMPKSFAMTLVKLSNEPVWIQAFYIRMCVWKNPNLLRTKAFTNWSMKHAGLII